MTKEKKILLNYLLKQYKESLREESVRTTLKSFLQWYLEKPVSKNSLRRDWDDDAFMSIEQDNGWSFDDFYNFIMKNINKSISINIKDIGNVYENTFTINNIKFSIDSIEKFEGE